MLVVGMMVRESVTVVARADRARVVRLFAGGVLGAGHPSGEVAVLLVSELFTNSVQHGGSGMAGETVTVAVMAGRGMVRVEVADLGGAGVPQLRRAGGSAESGRGLTLVDALSTEWGWRRRGRRIVTWFELRRN